MFNRAHLIGETLNSLLVQTHANWECIVVDDGSSDNTATVMNSYLEKDARFRYYHRPAEHLPGGNGARNYGFLKSSGHYIQWFDSDDIMMPNFIEAKMQPFLLKPDTDVVFSGFENVNSKGDRTRVANQSFSGNIIDDLVDGHVSFGPLSFMLRRDKISRIKYDETLKKNQDLDFFFRLFTSDEKLKIVHINKILYTVNAHPDSMTKGTSRDVLKMASMYKVYLMVLDYFAKREHSKGISRYKYKCLNTLKMMLQNGNYREVINRLLPFKYLNSFQRTYLLGCVVAYFLLKRGANQFIKIDLKD